LETNQRRNMRMTKRDDGGGGRKVWERKSRQGKKVCDGKEEMRK
jgi:hypothetical protein